MNAAIDYTSLTTGLQTAFEGGVTTALPVAGAVIAAFLVIRTIRRVVKA
jgi:TctA family transporter